MKLQSAGVTMALVARAADATGINALASVETVSDKVTEGQRAGYGQIVR